MIFQRISGGWGSAVSGQLCSHFLDVGSSHAKNTLPGINLFYNKQCQVNCKVKTTSHHSIACDSVVHVNELVIIGSGDMVLIPALAVFEKKTRCYTSFLFGRHEKDIRGNTVVFYRPSSKKNIRGNTVVFYRPSSKKT